MKYFMILKRPVNYSNKGVNVLLDKLRGMYKENNDIIKLMNKRQSECSICGGTGFAKETDNLMTFGVLSFPKNCECSEIDNKTQYYYQEKLNKIKKAHDYYVCQIPEDHKLKNGVDISIISDDEVKFLTSDKMKVLWLYNRGKGGGKSTRAYAMLAMNRALKDYNSNFYNEAYLSYDKYTKSYDLDLDNNDLIVIDDLGAEVEKNKQIALSKFYYKLFTSVRRYDSKIIITSQYSIREFVARLKNYEQYNEQLKRELIEQSERIESRLKGIALEKTISIKGVENEKR